MKRNNFTTQAIKIINALAIILISIHSSAYSKAFEKTNDSINHSDLILVNEGTEIVNRRPSLINSMVKYKSQIYFTTNYGIYRLNEKTKKSEAFMDGIEAAANEKVLFEKILIHKNDLYACSLNKGIYKLDSKKMIWKSFNEGLPLMAGFFDFVSCDNKLYIPTYDSGVYVNKGSKWTKINEDKIKAAKSCICLDSGILIGNDINELFIIKSNEILSNYEKQLAIVPTESTGIEGESEVNVELGILDMIKLDNRIYVASHVNGVFISGDNGKIFDNKIPFNANFLSAVDHYIIMGHYMSKKGLFVLDDKKMKYYQLNLDLNHVITCAKSIEDFVYIGTNTGLIYKIKKAKLIEIIKTSIQ